MAGVRRGAQMARVLRQGPAVVGCEGRTCAEHSVRRLTNRQEVVQLTREAGGGLTWAEQFMLKRKRLQDSK